MPTGEIQFVADASQLKSESEGARKSVAAVASAAEDARKRIVESYQQQVAAAKEAGASQSQLASITTRSSAMLASVTEDSANRYIKAIDRMEDRTRRFNAARATLSASTTTTPTSSFDLGGYAGETGAANDLTQAVEGVNAAHTRGVSSAVQFGSVIRGLEGNFSRNVRAAEVFGSTLGFLGPLVEAAFPVVGAVTLGYAIFEMGKHAYDAWENVVNLKSAIEGLNSLQIDTDKDAKRDRDAVENATESILDKTAGRSASLQQKYSYQSNQPVDLSSLFQADVYKKLPDDIKGNYESTYKSIAPADLPTRLKLITETVNGLRSALAGVKDGSISAFNLPVFNGASPNATRDPARYYEAQLNVASQIQQRLSGANDARTANLQSIQADAASTQEEEAKKGAQKVLEAQRKARDEQRQQWADELAEWQASGDKSAGAIAEWWAIQAVTTAKSSANFSDAMRHANDELVKVRADTAKQTKEYEKAIGELNNEQNADVQQGSDLSGADRDAKNYAAWANNVNQLRLVTQQNADAIEQQSIQQDVATGKISKLGAAYETAALHAREYQQSLAALQQQQDALDNNSHLSDPERKAAQSSIDLQRGQLNGKHDSQQQQDNTAVLSAYMSALNGINQNLAALMTGGKTNWSGMFRSAGQDLATAGLKKVEAPVLSALGLGKADGSSGSPFHVIVQNFGGVAGAAGQLIGDAGSGIGGFFKNVAGWFTGRAVGGNVDPNSSYLVGEHGPEVLTLGNQSGRVTPNSQLGGSSGHTFYIDASNSTDPAQTAAAVQRGIVAATPHIASLAIRGVSEQRKRSPSSRAQ